MSVKPAYWLWPLFWLLWATPVFATAISGVYVVSTGSLGTDSTELYPDSVYFFWYDNGALSLDSQKATPVNDDSLAWYTILVPATESWGPAYQPAVWAQWYWDSDIDRDASVGVVPWTIGHVDSLDQTITASASIDTSDMEYIAGLVEDTLTTNHGAGAWTSDAAGTGAYSDSVWVVNSADTTAIGSGVAVWLTPNGGGTVLKDLTDPNSWAVFSVDADTYLVTMWAVGYYTTTVPDTNAVPGANTKDTVYMTATTAASPPAPNLTPITFNFFDGTGDSVKNVGLRYHLDAGGADVAYHFDSTKIFDPTEIFEAWTDASGQVTVNVVPNDSIYVRGLQTGKTRWVFRAYSPETGKELFGPNGIKLNVTASATALTYPKDFTE